jgi:hypothetical protein
VPSWFRRSTPKPLSSNPGRGPTGSVAFARGDKVWEERFDLVALLASVLQQHGHATQIGRSQLVLKKSALIVLPQFFELQPLDKGGVRTTTTIQTHHPTLVPDGVFEYQHATGDNAELSLREGFNQWVITDLLALLESLQPKPETCTSLEMKFPEKDGKPAYSRRVILGPVTHTIQHPRTASEQNLPKADGENCEEHEFCPCCLLTNSYDAFRDLIESPGFYGLRLFAMRDEYGNHQADCRVNGNDFEPGAVALRNYVARWPSAGLELRKQYVVVHRVEG